MTNLEQQQGGSRERKTSVSPAAVNVGRRSIWQALAAVVALAGCGKSGLLPEVPENNLCTTIPVCPDAKLGFPYGNLNVYDADGRWRRINPVTGEITQVCDVVPRKPVLPICADAPACDPIPAREKDGPWRFPSQANLPVISEYVPALGYLLLDTSRYPVIFDSAPDCGPGESPAGQSYYSCDLIPTCPPAQRVPYCDPLPRCRPGESPIRCEGNSGGYTYREDCERQAEEIGFFLGIHGYRDFPFSGMACKEITFGNGEKGWDAPLVRMTCLVTPECKPGEKPNVVDRDTTLECEGLGTWVSHDVHMASCDVIPSCR